MNAEKKKTIKKINNFIKLQKKKIKILLGL